MITEDINKAKPSFWKKLKFINLNIILYKPKSLKVNKVIGIKIKFKIQKSLLNKKLKLSCRSHIEMVREKNKRIISIINWSIRLLFLSSFKRLFKKILNKNDSN